MTWILDRFRLFDQQLIAVDETSSLTYADFSLKIERWMGVLDRKGISVGDRVGLIAEYHIEVVAIIQALLEIGCIVIPLSVDDQHFFAERLDTAHANKVIRVRSDVFPTSENLECVNHQGQESDIHLLMIPLLDERKAGFVIFTSGSTGKSKAVLLEYDRLIKKFKNSVKQSFRTLLFLKLDHIGGLNTLLSVILNGGTVVTAKSRAAKDICHAVQAYSVELLPTTPSFLTMLLMSKLHLEFDLSSLKVITYGTEVMPNSTLAGIHRTFPSVKLKQTYGLSELGILSTQSKNSESKWMKIGGEGFEIKVKEDILWIKSDQAMLGYLNAESPFDSEGWYNTGDKVEVDGEYFRILGRESEIINVAGEKVFPIEIESYLLTLENVKDVIVRGKKSPVTGQVIWAEFLLEKHEDFNSFKKRIIDCCSTHFAPYKIPRLITLAEQEALVGSRFKKIRKIATEAVV